jgi:hypothetical protein
MNKEQVNKKVFSNHSRLEQWQLQPVAASPLEVDTILDYMFDIEFGDVSIMHVAPREDKDTYVFMTTGLSNEAN